MTLSSLEYKLNQFQNTTSILKKNETSDRIKESISNPSILKALDAASSSIEQGNKLFSQGVTWNRIVSCYIRGINENVYSNRGQRTLVDIMNCLKQILLLGFEKQWRISSCFPQIAEHVCTILQTDQNQFYPPYLDLLLRLTESPSFCFSFAWRSQRKQHQHVNAGKSTSIAFQSTTSQSSDVKVPSLDSVLNLLVVLSEMNPNLKRRCVQCISNFLVHTQQVLTDSALELKLFEIPAAVCLEASSMDEGLIGDALYLLKTLIIMHRESHLGGIGHASSCPLCSSSFRSFWTSSWKILRMQMNRRKTYQITIEVMSELVTESMTRQSLDGSPEPKDTVGVNMDQSRQKRKHTSLLKEITRIDESNMFPGHVQKVAPSGPAKVSLSTFLLDSLQQTLSLLITDFKNHHIHQTPTTTILSSTPQDSQIEQKSQDLFNVMDSIILLLSTRPFSSPLISTYVQNTHFSKLDSVWLFVFATIQSTLSSFSFSSKSLTSSSSHSLSATTLPLQFFQFTLHRHPCLVSPFALHGIASFAHMFISNPIKTLNFWAFACLSHCFSHRHSSSFLHPPPPSFRKFHSLNNPTPTPPLSGHIRSHSTSTTPATATTSIPFSTPMLVPHSIQQSQTRSHLQTPLTRSSSLHSHSSPTLSADSPFSTQFSTFFSNRAKHWINHSSSFDLAARQVGDAHIVQASLLSLSAFLKNNLASHALLQTVSQAVLTQTSASFLSPGHSTLFRTVVARCHSGFFINSRQTHFSVERLLQAHVDSWTDENVPTLPVNSMESFGVAFGVLFFRGNSGLSEIDAVRVPKDFEQIGNRDDVETRLKEHAFWTSPYLQFLFGEDGETIQRMSQSRSLSALQTSSFSPLGLIEQILTHLFQPRVVIENETDSVSPLASTFLSFAFFFLRFLQTIVSSLLSFFRSKFPGTTLSTAMELSLFIYSNTIPPKTLSFISLSFQVISILHSSLTRILLGLLNILSQEKIEENQTRDIESLCDLVKEIGLAQIGQEGDESPSLLSFLSSFTGTDASCSIITDGMSISALFSILLSSSFSQLNEHLATSAASAQPLAQNDSLGVDGIVTSPLQTKPEVQKPRHSDFFIDDDDADFLLGVGNVEETKPAKFQPANDHLHNKLSKSLSNENNSSLNLSNKANQTPTRQLSMESSESESVMGMQRTRELIVESMVGREAEAVNTSLKMLTVPQLLVLMNNLLNSFPKTSSQCQFCLTRPHFGSAHSRHTQQCPFITLLGKVLHSIVVDEPTKASLLSLSRFIFRSHFGELFGQGGVLTSLLDQASTSQLKHINASSSLVLPLLHSLDLFFADSIQFSPLNKVSLLHDSLNIPPQPGNLNEHDFQFPDTAIVPFFTSLNGILLLEHPTLLTVTQSILLHSIPFAIHTISSTQRNPNAIVPLNAISVILTHFNSILTQPETPSLVSLLQKNAAILFIITTKTFLETKIASTMEQVFPTSNEGILVELVQSIVTAFRNQSQTSKAVTHQPQQPSYHPTTQPHTSTHHKHQHTKSKAQRSKMRMDDEDGDWTESDWSKETDTSDETADDLFSENQNKKRKRPAPIKTFDFDDSPAVQPFQEPSHNSQDELELSTKNVLCFMVVLAKQAHDFGLTTLLKTSLSLFFVLVKELHCPMSFAASRLHFLVRPNRLEYFMLPHFAHFGATWARFEFGLGDFPFELIGFDSFSNFVQQTIHSFVSSFLLFSNDSLQRQTLLQLVTLTTSLTDTALQTFVEAFACELSSLEMISPSFAAILDSLSSDIAKLHLPDLLHQNQCLLVMTFALKYSAHLSTLPQHLLPDNPDLASQLTILSAFSTYSTRIFSEIRSSPNFEKMVKTLPRTCEPYVLFNRSVFAQIGRYLLFVTTYLESYSDFAEIGSFLELMLGFMLSFLEYRINTLWAPVILSCVERILDKMDVGLLNDSEDRPYSASASTLSALNISSSPLTSKSSPPASSIFLGVRSCLNVIRLLINRKMVGVDDENPKTEEQLAPFRVKMVEHEQLVNEAFVRTFSVLVPLIDKLANQPQSVFTVSLLSQAIAILSSIVSHTSSILPLSFAALSHLLRKCSSTHRLVTDLSKSLHISLVRVQLTPQVVSALIQNFIASTLSTVDECYSLGIPKSSVNTSASPSSTISRSNSVAIPLPTNSGVSQQVLEQLQLVEHCVLDHRFENLLFKLPTESAMIIQAAVFSIQWTELHNPASEFYPSETHRLLLTLSLHLVASTSPHASMRANALSALGDIGIWTPFLHSALPVIKRIYPTNYPDDQQLTLNILQSLFSLVYNERLDSATFIQLSTSLQSVMHLDGSMAATRLPELERRILAGFKQTPLSKYDSEWTSARKGSVLDNSIDTTQPQDKQSLQLGVSSTALLSPNTNTTIGSPNSFTSSTTLPSPLSSMNSVELASPRSNALVIPSPFDVPYRQFVTDFCSTLASHSPFSFLRTLKPLFAISVELSEKLVMPLLLDCLWSDAPANITTLSVFFETIFKPTAEPDSPDGSEDGMMVDDTPTHIPRIEASIFRFLLSVLEQIRQHDTIQLRTILNRDSSPFDQNMNHTTLFGKCLVQYRQASHPPLDEEYPSSLFSLLHIDLIEAAQVAVRVEMHDFALLLVEMWCGQVVEEYHEAKVKSAQAILQAIFELNSKSTQRSSTQLKAQSARLSEKLAQVTGNLFIDPTTVISKGVWNGRYRKVVGGVMSEASLRLGCVDAVDGLGVVLGSDLDDFVSVPMMHSDWTNAISSFEVRMSLHNDLRMNGSVHTRSLPPHQTGRDQPHCSVLIQQHFPDYVNVGDDRKQLFLSFVESLRMAGFSSIVQTVLNSKAGLAQDGWEEHSSCCFNEAWHDLKKWPDQPDKFASVWNGEKETKHNPSTGLVSLSPTSRVIGFDQSLYGFFERMREGSLDEMTTWLESALSALTITTSPNQISNNRTLETVASQATLLSEQRHLAEALLDSVEISRNALLSHDGFGDGMAVLPPSQTPHGDATIPQNDWIRTIKTLTQTDFGFLRFGSQSELIESRIVALQSANMNSCVAEQLSVLARLARKEKLNTIAQKTNQTILSILSTQSRHQSGSADSTVFPAVDLPDAIKVLLSKQASTELKLIHGRGLTPFSSDSLADLSSFGLDSHEFQPPQPLDSNDPNHAIQIELASLSVRTLAHVGRSLTDSRKARPMEILKACYVPAAEHAPKQTALACRMWFKLAKYSDELFRHRMERLQSADYKAAEQNMVDHENTAKRTLLVADDERNNMSGSRDWREKRARAYESKARTMELMVRHFREEQKELTADIELTLSTTVHALVETLVNGEGYDVQAIFQLFSLWTQNWGNEQVRREIQTGFLDTIPSHKLIPLAHQLTARVKISDLPQPSPLSPPRTFGAKQHTLDTFRSKKKKPTETDPTQTASHISLFGNESSEPLPSQHILNRAVFRMSSEHPHKMLIHLYSVLHSSQPGKRRDAVSGILTALKEDHTLSVLVSDYEVLVDTYRNLAELVIDTKQKKKRHRLPDSFDVLKGKSHIPVVTVNPPFSNEVGSTPLSPMLPRLTPIQSHSTLQRHFSSNQSLTNSSAFASPRFSAQSSLNRTQTLTSMTPTSGCVGISSFDEWYSLPGGVNVPKRITCIGTDGREYIQLVKGKDDMRQDAVMQQLFGIVNGMLKRDHNGIERGLRMRTYRVVPLGSKQGVIEWVKQTVSFQDYLVSGPTSAHERYRPDEMKHIEIRQFLNQKKDETDEEKVRAFQTVCVCFTPLFRHFFTENYTSSIEWYEKRLAYTRSVGVSSIVGWVAGLGDRHAQNILVDKTTGEVVHIDLGIAFEQGQQLSIPERVPFRLTREVVDGFGSLGVEGSFAKCCEECLRVCRKARQSIVAVVAVLLDDPLYRWEELDRSVQRHLTEREEKMELDGVTLIGVQDSSIDNDQKSGKSKAGGRRDAERVIIRLKEKLSGFSGQDAVSEAQQVKELIQEARDPRNLAPMFQGWSQWL